MSGDHILKSDFVDLSGSEVLKILCIGPEMSWFETVCFEIIIAGSD